MNRRDFLKSMLAVGTLAPLALSGEKLQKTGNKISKLITGKQVTRRPWRDSDTTLPLLGYGMMRLPKNQLGGIDDAEVKKYFDRAMQAGVNYFDTAYFYHGGESELCAGRILKNYPRDSFYLASKMPVGRIKKQTDVAKIFAEQLKKTQAGYFDFYLLHSLNRGSWKRAQEFEIYEFLKQQQAKGLIHYLGFSFHDTPEVLEEIASAKQWDFAQIQLNYLDWELYRSKEQYNILTAKNIPVIVMEPLRGGALAQLNPQAVEILHQAAPQRSTASWAFRYAGSLPNVLCILSGMTKLEHLEDNIKTFTDFTPLNETEKATLDKALTAFRGALPVPCTDCKYCMPCPAGVNIPKNFALYNQFKLSNRKQNFKRAYKAMPTDEWAKECVECGACLKKCPQKINIPEKLAIIAKLMD